MDMVVIIEEKKGAEVQPGVFRSNLEVEVLNSDLKISGYTTGWVPKISFFDPHHLQTTPFSRKELFSLQIL